MFVLLETTVVLCMFVLLETTVVLVSGSIPDEIRGRICFLRGG
jgi:hypothetical protein